MNIAISLILGIVTSITGWLGYMQLTDQEVSVGGFSDPFLSLQLAANPVNNYILSTDGTNNSWIVNSGGGGGGSSKWTDEGAVLSPNEGEGIRVDYVIATSTATTSTFVNLTVSGTLTGTLTGNADTATALAANGANCSAGNSPLGVDASGAVESCFDVWTEAENTSAAYISGNQTITLSGDVSGSGATSITTTIGSDTVDFTMIDNTITLAGNPALEANDCFFGDNGIICEGTTADNFEGLLSFPITTSDKTWTFPNTTGTVALLTSAMTGTYDGNNFAGGAIGTGDLLYGASAGSITELSIGASSTLLASSGTSPTWLAASAIVDILEASIEAALDTLNNLVDIVVSGSLRIPVGTNPTVDTDGEIAIDTTAGQFVYDGGNGNSVITGTSTGGFSVASTTFGDYGKQFNSATTTFLLMLPPEPLTMQGFYCKVRGGTSVVVRFGDGTASTTHGVCTTSGVFVNTSSNNTWTQWENLLYSIGSNSGAVNRVIISPVFNKTRQ